MPVFDLYFPWETAEGEGFIAPWSTAVETPAGLVSGQAAQPGDVFNDGPEFFNPNLQAGLPGGPSAAPPTPYPYYPPPDTGTPPPPPPGINGVNTGGQGAPPAPGDDLDSLKDWWTDWMGSRAEGNGGDGQVFTGQPPTATNWWGPLVAAGGTALAGLLASRFKAPWETAEGEGFIAPWTQQTQLPSGQWGQAGVTYPGQNGVTSGGLNLGNFNAAQLSMGLPVKAWTNASRDGRIPPTVRFILFSNGRMASQSLIDGVVKTWRPKKHVVISSNPRMSQVRKLDNLHRRVVKRLGKMKALKRA